MYAINEKQVTGQQATVIITGTLFLIGLIWFVAIVMPQTWHTLTYKSPVQKTAACQMQAQTAWDAEDYGTSQNAALTTAGKNSYYTNSRIAYNMALQECQADNE